MEFSGLIILSPQIHTTCPQTTDNYYGFTGLASRSGTNTNLSTSYGCILGRKLPCISLGLVCNFGGDVAVFLSRFIDTFKFLAADAVNVLNYIAALERTILHIFPYNFRILHSIALHSCNCWGPCLWLQSDG